MAACLFAESASAPEAATSTRKCPKRGVIKQDDLGASKIALVYGQMNEPPALACALPAGLRSPNTSGTKRIRSTVVH